MIHFFRNICLNSSFIFSIKSMMIYISGICYKYYNYLKKKQDITISYRKTWTKFVHKNISQGYDNVNEFDLSK